MNLYLSNIRNIPSPQMLKQIPLVAFQEIPFFKKPLDPHCVFITLDFYVNGEWHCWIPNGDKLFKIKAWPVEAYFFADKQDRNSDQCFDLLNLMAQRTLTEEMCRDFSALWNDYQGLSASLAKLRLYNSNRDN
jgi:hypothetical protein